MHARRGFSLAELFIALVIAGLLMALAIPPVLAIVDRTEVDAAVRELGALFASARAQAMASGRPVAVVIDTVLGEVRVGPASAGVARTRYVAAIHHVSLSATRDSMSYDARGLGRGAANLTVIVRRGAASDSVVVSRLGRVRQ